MIAEGGPLSVAAYMALALDHPRHGYYATRDPFGQRGDFTTAPEISQLFGECLAVWCALVWESMARPVPVGLVELGPGRGTLMADLLRTLDRIAPALAAGAQVHLVESSPVLRSKQEALLAAKDGKRSIAWHETFSRVPVGPLILFANEFFDALPIHQFIRAGGGWRERQVAWDDAAARLVFRAGSALPGLVPPALEGAAEGSVYETCPVALALAEEIGQRLAAHPGAALVIDFGRRRTAVGDSLAAIQSGRKDVDPLAAPGEADLAAAVDFAALGQAFGQGGAHCFGPVTQRDLLRALGLETRLVRLQAGAAGPAAGELATGAERLIAPERMGSLFLALAALSPGLPAPPGFATAP
jgi:NADH dehydrogenase [ubiquinone] 1 alpha subcomplex assembly factor 7